MRRVAIALALGIILAEHFFPHLSPLALWSTPLLLLAMVGCYFAIRHRELTPARQWGFGLLTTLFFVSAGIALHQANQPRSQLPAGPCTLRLQLRDNPQETERRYRTRGDVVQILQQGCWQDVDERVMVYFAKEPAAQRLSSGDMIEIEAYLRQPDSNSSYSDYLRHKKIKRVCFTDSSRYTLLQHLPTTLYHRAQNLQRLANAVIERSTLSPQNKATTAALLLGRRDHRLQATRQQYTNAGIVHLLCVSGLHVGLLLGIVSWILRAVGNRRWQRWMKTIIRLAALWLFVLIAGMSAATLRAGIMFSFFIVGQALHRSHDSLNTLFASASLMLLCNTHLLFDIGFQYSYAAMIGIVCLHPRVYRLLRKKEETKSDEQNDDRPAWLPVLRGMGSELWSIVSLTLSAQLMVLPLSLLHFGQMPTYFLVSNVLIIPFAGLILGVALLMMALSWWPSVGNIVAWMLNAMLNLVDGLTLRIGSLPHSVLTVTHFGLGQAALVYVAIYLLYRWLDYSESRHAVH